MTDRRFAADCIAMLRPHKVIVARTLLLTLVSAASFGVFDPIATKYLIDSIVQRRIVAFIVIAVLLVLLNTAFRGLNYLAALHAERLKNAVANDLILDAFGAFYRTRYRDIVGHDTGYFVTRLFDEPSRVADAIVQSITAFATSLLTVLGAACVAFWLSWQLAILVVIVVPCILRLSRTARGTIASLTREVSEDEAVLRAGIGRAVESYKTVTVFDLHTVVTTTVGALLETYLGKRERRVRSSASFQAQSGIVLGYAELIMMIGAGVEVVLNRLTIGGLFAFMQAYARLVTSANVIITQIPTIARLSGELARIEEFNERGQPQAVRSNNKRVDLHEIVFGYGDHVIFNRMTLAVERGQRLLVTGPNGSGKSTLAYIVAGLLEGNGGEHRVPPLERVSALLLPFGFIPGTVRDNINLASLPEHKKRLFFSLAERFNIQGRLEQDPIRLSQGEQKKLQIVMTLLKDADFYVFDEPLANIDVESKRPVMEAIVAATQGRGLIVVMHGDEQFAKMFDRYFDIRGSA